LTIRLDVSRGGDVELYHFPEGAVVYLDHHALMNAAEQYADDFVAALALQGSTLALSWVNFVQLSEVSDQTLEPVGRLLGRIQPRVVFLDTNLARVAQKEADVAAGKRRDPAFLHDEWAGLVFRYGRKGSLDPLDLPTFLNSFKSPELKKSFEESQASAASEFGEMFEDARRRMASSSEIRKNVYAHPARSGVVMAPLHFLELVKYLVKNRVNVLEGDNMNDCWHANVSTCYCDFVVLDKQWVKATTEAQAQLDKVGRLDWRAQVFRDVPTLLPALRAWMPARTS